MSPHLSPHGQPMLEAQPWFGEGVKALGVSPEPGGLLFL